MLCLSFVFLANLSSVEHSLQRHDHRELSLPLVQTVTRPGALVTSTGIANEKEPVNVMFSLSGTNEGFLAEFEVSLKSVLLNAPLDADLNLHVLADSKALGVLPDIWNHTGIYDSVWRSKITLTTYNVDPFVKKWSRKIEQLYNKPIEKIVRHTIASYFRLFVNDVLPDSVSHVLYMDTDVVIMANLANLWSHIDRSGVIYQWGRDHCAGFVILNVKRVPIIWDVASKVDMKTFSKERRQKYGDQLILKAVNWTEPEMVAFLPDEWALSIANGGLWKHTKKLDKYRPQVGMFHFNGAGRSKNSYWKNENAPIQRYPDKYGLAIYYVNLPWSWALFLAKSQITQGEGHPIVIRHQETDKLAERLSDAGHATDMKLA